MSKKLTKKQLEEMVQSLAWNEGFGCYNRQGFENWKWPEIEEDARWIIFFDVDDMHELNKKYGYAGVNAILKKCLATRGTDVVAGQWFSGDEFVICVRDGDPKRDESNPIDFCIRLSQVLKENEVSATFAIAPVVSSDISVNVTPAHQLCQEAKSHLQRGTISIVPGDPR